MTVVFDTNIVASATFWRGKPGLCLEAWASGRFNLAISHPILTEYEDVVGRLKRRYASHSSVDWLGPIKAAAHFYFPGPVSVQSSDSKDQIFLECAISARADYLVTGDKGDLLVLKSVDSVQIVSASDFLKAL